MMNDIDDIFKDKLRDSGLEYKEYYWDNMEQLLNRKKRRKAILLFGTLFIAISGAVIGFSVFQGETKASGESILNTPALQYSSTNLSDETKTSGKVTLQAENITQTMSGSVNEQSEKNGTERYGQLSDNIVIKNQDVKSSDNKESVILPATSANAMILESSNAPVTIVDAENSQLMMYGFKPVARIVPEFGTSLISYTPFYSNQKTGGKLPSDNKDENNKSPWLYFVSAGAEYNQYERQVANTGFKKDERTVNTIGYNLNFTGSKNNWSFKTGLGFLQLEERTNYNTINTFYKYDTTYRLVDPNYGQTIAGTRIALIRQKVDTSIFSNQTVKNPDARVQFNYLKVPLIVGYEFRFGALGLLLDAGLNTAFLMQKKGVYTEFSGNDFRLKDASQSRDFNKVLFQTYTAAGLKYHIGKRWSIVGSYGLTQSLNSMVKSYQQKARVNFMSVGLEIRL